MTYAVQGDRAILAVSGDDSSAFLNRLLTNNVPEEPEAARYGALLTAQGKIICDLLLYRFDEVILIDVDAVQHDDLLRRLQMFRLRAKITIEPRPDLAVAARWGEQTGAGARTAALAVPDPRHAGLGNRLVGSRERLDEGDDANGDYRTHRMTLGVPAGGVDFPYGDSFVHDANLDVLNGVDFSKGCYVGQEVVSRVHHRGSARRRIVRLDVHGAPLAPGTALTAGPIAIGQVTSAAGTIALASVRIDRLAEAVDTRLPVVVGETLVTVHLPEPGSPVATAPA